MTLPGRSPDWRGWGGGRKAEEAGRGKEAGLNEGPAGRARPPEGCGLEALSGAVWPRIGGAWDVGEAVRRPRAERGRDALAAAVATSRSEGGSSLLPLAAGLGALLSPGGAVRSPALRRPAGYVGILGPACPARATMNGLAVPGPGGSGHLRPGRPSAWAPTPAGQAPELLSGAEEDRLGSALSLELPRLLFISGRLGC